MENKKRSVHRLERGGLERDGRGEEEEEEDEEEDG